MATSAAPDIVRSAYAELIVTDLGASKHFWVDRLGFVISCRRRRSGLPTRPRRVRPSQPHPPQREPSRRVSRFAFRVRTPEDLDRAAVFHTDRDCEVRRYPAGHDSRRRPDGPRAGSVRIRRGVLPRHRVDRSSSSAIRPAPRGQHQSARSHQPRDRRRAGVLRVVHRVGLRAVGDHRGRRRHAVRDVDVPQADSARHRVDPGLVAAIASPRVRVPRIAPHPQPRRHARRHQRVSTTSNAVPAATASPTRSTSTCATPMDIASRSTPPITSPAIPVTNRCGGASTINGDATSGPTRSCQRWYEEASRVLDLDGKLQPIRERKERRAAHHRRSRRPSA